MTEAGAGAESNSTAEPRLGAQVSTELVERTLQNLALIALGYRAVATLVALIGVAGSSTLGTRDLRSLELVTAVVLGAHAALLVAGLRRRLPPTRRWIMSADIAVAIGLNLWASDLVPQDGLFFDYGNPFSGYAVATLALWTGAKGRRFGLWLLGVFAVPVQMLMAVANGTSLARIDLAKLLMRSLWFVLSFAVAQLLLDALRQAAEGLAYESEQAGREARKEELLRDLHNGVLQALLGMEARATNQRNIPQATLEEIEAEARRWSAHVRGMLAAGEDPWNGLFLEMTTLVEQAADRGQVRPELQWDGAEPRLEARVGRALVGAAAEAIHNVERHANATVLSIRITPGTAEVRVVVTDDGVGFENAGIGPESYGIPNSIRAALHDVGGRAEVTSILGHGTQWELSVPCRQSPATLDLAERTILDLALVPIWYRALGLLIAAAGLVGSRSFGKISLRPLLCVMAVVAMSQLGIIGVGRRRRTRPTSAWITVADVALAAGLNLWAATAVPAGTVFLDYRDPFGLYSQATLALWGAVRRWALGLALLAFMAIPLQLAMAVANGISLVDVDWPKLASRALWLAPALLLAKFVMSVARRGAILLAEENHRGGLAAERSDVLRELHASVLPGLEAIADRARAGTGVDGQSASDLADVATLARIEAARIRATLRRAPSPGWSPWPELEALVAEIESEANLRVELVWRGAPPPERQRMELLLEVLSRILRQAASLGPCHATMFVEAGDTDLRIVVRHDGCPTASASRSLLVGGQIKFDVSTTSDGHERWEFSVGLSTLPVRGLK
jgi:signal transduction histidine kinase